ncbi:MAG: RICIN domain-containing protein [Pseudobacter sp.]|uniref:RICIN domain-containing protein n=1 Tax=Pseudobacter sp. TaxID=2045420 RepID=UPI003F7FFDFD
MKAIFLSLCLLVISSVCAVAQTYQGSPPKDGRYYKIRVVQSGKYVSVHNGSNDNGARLMEWPYEDKRWQKFLAKKNTDASWSFFCLHGNKAICTEKGDGSEDDKVVLGSASQYSGRWVLNYTTDCLDGWQIKYALGDKRPMQIVPGGFFGLKLQVYQDAALDCSNTYFFEEVEAPPVDGQSRPVHLKPGGILKKKN